MYKNELIVGGLLVVVVLAVAGRLSSHDHGNIDALADGINKHLPKNVAGDLRLDSVTSDHDMLNYHYVVTDARSISIYENQGIEVIEKNLVDNYCNNKKYATFKYHGWPIHFVYSTPDKKFIAEAYADNSSCKH